MLRSVPIVVLLIAIAAAACGDRDTPAAPDSIKAPSAALPSVQDSAPDYSVIDLGTLGGTFAHPMAINDAGQVVGLSVNTAGQGRAFLWEDGVMIDLGTLGGHSSSAFAINNAG